MRAHMAMHAQARWISEGNVGLEAQFFSRANEQEFRLGLRFPVGLQGHLSKNPSGELMLRWPRRPAPPLHEIAEVWRLQVA